MHINSDDIHRQKMKALEAAWDAARSGADYEAHLRSLRTFGLAELTEDYHPDLNHVSIAANGAGGHVCPTCRAHDGRVYQITHERWQPHLPCADCTCLPQVGGRPGFCLCYYEPVFDDEL